MIKKEDLLAYLKENLDREEKGIPLYTMHLSSAMFLSNAKPEDQEKIKKVLAQLKEESERHKKMYEAMIKRVKEENQDVY